MNKFTYIFLLILFGFSANDIEKHSYVLEWEDLSGQGEVSGVCSFEDCEYLDAESRLPYFVYSIPTTIGNNYHVELADATFEEVEFDSDYAHVADNFISDHFNMKTSLAKSAQKQILHIDILPFKKVDGKYYRLTKFDLKYIPYTNTLKSIAFYNWKTESVLNSGKWLKIETSEKGIFKIPYNSLSEWGFSNPQNVNVFGNDGYALSENTTEVPYDDLTQLSIWKGKDNSGNDCLFFYATGNTKWNFDNNDNKFVHKTNVYASSSYYYLTEDVGNEKVAEKYDEITSSETHVVNSFDEHILYEKELENLIESGKQWFGENFINGTSKNISIECASKVEDALVYMTVRAAGKSGSNTKLGLSVNNTYNDSISFSKISSYDSYTHAKASSKNISFIPSLENLSVKLTYNASNSTDEAWLDYLELNYRRDLTFPESKLFFRDVNSVGNGNIANFSISNATSALKVFDITEVNNMVEVPGNLDGSTLSFKRPSEELSEYVIFDPTGDLPIPEKLGEVENQNLHATSSAEMIVITHPDFLDASNELADFHRSYDGMDVLVVESNQIFNEFSSGMADITSIRNYIKMSRDKNSNLKYILLFGDGSYDNRNILGNDKCFIPTYQSDKSLSETGSFITDDYLVLLDDGESVSDGYVDLGIGRIPCSSSYEAGIVVDKIKNYYKPASLGSWRNVISFIADDQDGQNNSGDETVHMTQSETLAGMVNSANAAFVTDKIYLDAYLEDKTSAGERYPDVVDQINERVDQGVLILNYVGHANERFLADEHVLDVANINSWTNEDNLPIFVTATCEFSRFDDDESSAGEHILFNPSGGGIGLFSTTRLVYSGENFNLSKKFYETVFDKDIDGKNLRLGDIMKNAKIGISSSSINKRSFSLLADPALRLAYPQYNVKTTTINHHDAESEADTIKALDEITISGYVEDFEGNKKTDFNGRLTPIVYGKAEMLETLGNDTGKPATFKVQDNIIYKGLASVTNGEFSFSFVIPKDIPYSLGIGKIIYYAENGETDGNGAFENFYIGGSSDDQITDNVGPDIQLYLDDTNFSSGDATSKNPILFAGISDENGINTVGSGIGYDIICTIDGDYSNSIVLNSYYQADIDNYKSGKIEYSLSELDLGEHTLTLKVWDVANNSSEAQIDFVVGDNLKIEEVYNIPNPVTSSTEFVFKHNQPNATFDARIEIMDRSGRIVDSFVKSVSSNGSSSVPVNWNPNTAKINLMDGIYLYRITIKDSNGTVASKTGKMIFIQ